MEGDVEVGYVELGAAGGAGHSTEHLQVHQGQGGAATLVWLRTRRWVARLVKVRSNLLGRSQEEPSSRIETTWHAKLTGSFKKYKKK